MTERVALVSEWLFMEMIRRMGEDAPPGVTYTVDWGRPDENGYYTPTVTQHTEPSA